MQNTHFKINASDVNSYRKSNTECDTNSSLCHFVIPSFRMHIPTSNGVQQKQQSPTLDIGEQWGIREWVHIKCNSEIKCHFIVVSHFTYLQYVIYTFGYVWIQIKAPHC